MTVVSIRSAEPSDTQAIAAVILPIQQEEFGIPTTLEAQPDLANIQQFYQHGSGNFWVAECDGSIVGTIALLDIGNRETALRKMFVAAPFRGREFGVAKRLLSGLMESAKQSGVTSIYLGTTAKFLAAQRFYEKNGFAEIPETELPATFPVMAVDTKFYRYAFPGLAPEHISANLDAE